MKITINFQSSQIVVSGKYNMRPDAVNTVFQLSDANDAELFAKLARRENVVVQVNKAGVSDYIMENVRVLLGRPLTKREFAQVKEIVQKRETTTVEWPV